MAHAEETRRTVDFVCMPSQGYTGEIVPLTIVYERSYGSYRFELPEMYGHHVKAANSKLKLDGSYYEIVYCDPDDEVVLNDLEFPVHHSMGGAFGDFFVGLLSWDDAEDPISQPVHHDMSKLVLGMRPVFARLLQWWNRGQDSLESLEAHNKIEKTQTFLRLPVNGLISSTNITPGVELARFNLKGPTSTLEPIERYRYALEGMLQLSIRVWNTSTFIGMRFSPPGKDAPSMLQHRYIRGVWGDVFLYPFTKQHTPQGQYKELYHRMTHDWREEYPILAKLVDFLTSECILVHINDFVLLSALQASDTDTAASLVKYAMKELVEIFGPEDAMMDADGFNNKLETDEAEDHLRYEARPCAFDEDRDTVHTEPEPR